MTYFATCSFDIQGASSDDYRAVYQDLAAIGLKKTVVSGTGKQVVAPTTMTMGEFTGASASGVRDALLDQVKKIMLSRRLSAELFLTVGGDWTWRAASV